MPVALSIAMMCRVGTSRHWDTACWLIPNMRANFPMLPALSIARVNPGLMLKIMETTAVAHKATLTIPGHKATLSHQMIANLVPSRPNR
jgi:hypothetical protein